jgi:hypothetical protein
VHAHMWLNLAASQGDAAARAGRESIENAMTPEQIAEAQARSTRCFESNYSDCD